MDNEEALSHKSFLDKAKQNLNKLGLKPRKSQRLQDTIRDLTNHLERQNELHAEERERREKAFATEIESIVTAFNKQKTENLEGWKRERDAWLEWVEHLKRANKGNYKGRRRDAGMSKAECRTFERDTGTSGEMEDVEDADKDEFSGEDGREKDLNVEIHDMKKAFENQLNMRDSRASGGQVKLEVMKASFLLLQLMIKKSKIVIHNFRYKLRKQKGQHAEEQRQALEREKVLCNKLYCVSRSLLTREKWLKDCKREKDELSERLLRLKELQSEREKAFIAEIKRTKQAYKKLKKENLEGWEREKQVWHTWVEHLKAAKGSMEQADTAEGPTSERERALYDKMEKMKEDFQIQLSKRAMREEELQDEIEDLRGVNQSFVNELSMRDIIGERSQAEADVNDAGSLFQSRKESKNNISQNFMKKLHKGQHAEEQWQALEKEMALIADCKRIMLDIKDMQGEI